MIIEYLLWALLAIIIIIGVYFVMSSLLVYGQTPTTEGLQPLPQDYYVITQLPKGISVAAQEQQSTGIPTDILGILAMVGSAGAYIKGHLVGKKTDKVEETTKEQSAQIVQSKEVEQSMAKTMFKLALEEKVQEMEGTAPEIKLETLAKNKEEAVKTATKA